MTSRPASGPAAAGDVLDLPGVDPAWSRRVTAADADGVPRQWHVLDNGVTEPRLTLLCVHGNPTWSFLWRGLLAAAPDGVRVVAVDHLDMGWSERTGTLRRLDRRISDLEVVAQELGVTGPLVTVAHDWGGPISLGWALQHPDQLVGVVLTNTAVHQPAGAAAPSVIRLARTPGIRDAVCVRSATFIRAATAMTGTPLSTEVKDAFLAPYRTADRRRAIGEFVADIPLEPTHPSAATLDGIAAGVAGLQVPALLVWGPRDPVFSERYLRDLMMRLPHADVHRVEGASHLVPEEPATVQAIVAWVNRLLSDEENTRTNAATEPAPAPAPDRRPIWAGIEDRADDESVALIDRAGGGRMTFRDLAVRVQHLAAGLPAAGVGPGDRVGLLIPPGPELAVALYGCWRAGAVPVVVDAGLGPTGIGRALRAADPAVLIGVPRALAAARTLRWPGRRILAGASSEGVRRSLGAVTTLATLEAQGRDRPLPPVADSDADAAVVFTSGATGPAKGVVYRHRQLEAQRDALAATFGFGPGDRMVAGFAPFAMYGPALGMASVVPDVPLTAPGRLTAGELADAATAIDATVVFASPAALRSVASSAAGLSAAQYAALERVRLLLSFGAPVPERTMTAAAALMPRAAAHTPYGMTEVLPVCTAELAAIRAAGAEEGVYVGHPTAGVSVAVTPLDARGVPAGELTTEPHVTGEVCVRADHSFDRYDALWLTTAAADLGEWHRTGDVGHLAADGSLWIEGRLAHVATGPAGPVTPVAAEQRMEALDAVAAAALVGVGPVGTQASVAVVVPADGSTSPGEAAPALRAAVRAVVPDVAAVLQVPALPVDRRHNAKVDRAAVAAWAADVLAGGSARQARRW